MKAYRRRLRLLWASCMLLGIFATNLDAANTRPNSQTQKGSDTVYLPEMPVLNSKYLKPGLRQYLVYITGPDKKNEQKTRIWQRRVSITTRNNHKVIVTQQNWLSADSMHFQRFSSVNNFTDFQPLYHFQQGPKGIAAYNWHANAIQGADTVADNRQKEFRQAFDRPNLNWNLDLETFEMLPMDRYKIFAINFYDAGIDTPQRLVYKVIGEQNISVYGSADKVPCWKLFMKATYKGMTFTETFWISQHTHELLMEKDDLGHGMYRYKIKLPDFAANTL